MTQIPPTDEESMVSMEDLEAFLERNTRSILQPIIPGQSKVGLFQPGTSGTPPTNVDETGEAAQTLPVPTGIDDVLEEEGEEGEGQPTDAGDEPSTEPPPPPTPTPLPSPDLIETSPGVFMTREAISTALSQRQPSPTPTGEVGGAGADSPVSTPAPTPTPPVFPPELLSDPELAPVVAALQQQQQTIETQQQSLAYLNDMVVARAREELEARVTAGISEFRTQHADLTDEQMEEINRVAANLQVLPALAGGTDPITNEPCPRDPQSATRRALEIAYWTLPQYREAELSSRVLDRAKDSQRKAKLAGVSGGSGSVPRTQPVPQDRRGRELAAVADLREMMSPGSEE